VNILKLPNERFKNLLKHIATVRYRWWVLAHDLAMIPLAWMLAYWFRYNLSEIPDEYMTEAVRMIPTVMLVQGAILIIFGVHRGVWRFTSTLDLVRLLKAAVIGTILVTLTIFMLNRLAFVPRSVFILYGILLALFLCGSRIGYRILKDRGLKTTVGTKALVVGAGAAGEQVVRDLLRNVPRRYDPIAFVDDDPAKINKDIHGIGVAGTCDAIPDLCAKWNIDLILIAVPSANDKQMQRIVRLCEASKVEFRTLPAIHDVVTGHVGLRDLRPVRIEDLLGRDPVSLDWRGIRTSLKGKRVLVTGAGGSIGSELCRQLAGIGMEELILFEQSEFNLYSVAHELNSSFPDLNTKLILGDICDSIAVAELYKRYQPEVVFHAAAYKHVPLLEGQVREAVKNNVLGTIVVAEQAKKHEVGTFVLISTDKAVNPTSLMGACKRIAEIYCQSLNDGSTTKYVIVRFGNVLGSAGSVVPLFRKQIEAGGPLTVTDPEITRYFMTLSEATQLILEASTVGDGGETYVLDMGEPVKVAYLAEQMIKLSGKTPGEDIEIVYTGLRPGEKIREELFYPEEQLVATSHEKIMLASNPSGDNANIQRVIKGLQEGVDHFDEKALLVLIKELVPHFDFDHMNLQGTPVDLLSDVAEL